MKKRLITSLAFCAAVVSLWAQSFQGQFRVVDTKGSPIKGVMMTAEGAAASVLSDEQGKATLLIEGDRSQLNVTADGYRSVSLPIDSRQANKTIVLVSNEWENLSACLLGENEVERSQSIDDALKNHLAGVQVIGKGGMPGEGAYFNIGGIHTLTADNKPLIVVNGVPYLGDDNVSSVIGGYSRGLFNSINIDDVQSISVLTGAAAATYGSLGSNGVILIETQQAKSDLMETKISLAGQYGMNFRPNTIDVLDADHYKNYLRQVGMTRYSQNSLLLKDYPFLQTTNDYPMSYIFDNNTRWNDEIYAPAFLTNNVFRVEGGDEIAKYNISVGYSSDGGVVKGTQSDRFQTLINSSILVTRNVDIFSTVGLGYLRDNLQEQGMNFETNPLWAANFNMPVLNPFLADANGKLTSVYAPYNYSNVQPNPLFPYENVSNPMALVNTMDIKDKIYDVSIQMGLNYRVNNYLKLTGLFNLFYRYTEEKMFIPGMTNQAIYPQYYNIGRNTVRMGISESRHNYYGLNATYHRVFDRVHDVQAQAGFRYIGSSQEYDMASGYNTANDFYKTLDKTNDEPRIMGFNKDWIWTNSYLNASYTYNQLLRAAMNVVVDASSVSGVDAPRYYVYPSGSLCFMAGNLSGMPSFINALDVKADYSLTGNSRFSSNYAKNYYRSQNYSWMGSIVRSDIPNTLLEPEKTSRFDASVDVSMLNKRVNFGLNYFDALSYDLLLPQEISSVYASKAYYDNAASIRTKGYGVSAYFVPVETNNFRWTVGGDIASNKSIVESLGEQTIVDLSLADYYEGEDAIVRLQVGEAPYQFYGYRANGIYQTTEEARQANLTSVYQTAYQAGDVRFEDSHQDGIINSDDKTLLGTATPDFFGSFFTTLRYGSVSLSAHFNYSVGNMAYNAVRRELESMDAFHNQSVSTLNRWQVEGQQTSMPRAAYGDPNGNNVFSSRWIEDASYVRLSNLTLRYHIMRPIANLFQSGSVWIAAENLLTLTNYLGADPELAYSYSESMLGIDYGKVPNPRSIKIGFNLNF